MEDCLMAKAAAATAAKAAEEASTSWGVWKHHGDWNFEIGLKQQRNAYETAKRSAGNGDIGIIGSSTWYRAIQLRYKLVFYVLGNAS